MTHGEQPATPRTEAFTRLETRMDRSALRGWEPLAVSMLEWCNATPGRKLALNRTIGQTSRKLIKFSTSRLWRIHGAEHVAGLAPSRGVILASNHRSFFDFYIVLSYLQETHPWALAPIFFPVRKAFFYERPSGILVNVLASGASMWPPVFRDERKSELNPLGFQQMAEALSYGSILGIHPEATRNLSDDPYTFLSAKPGLGRLVQVCDPETLVVPVFILGLSNTFKTTVTRQFRPEGERGEPIRVHFGEPWRCGDLAQPDGEAGGVSDAQTIVETVMARVGELGQQDKALVEAGGAASL